MTLDDILLIHPDTASLAEDIAAQLSFDDLRALEAAERCEDLGQDLTTRFFDLGLVTSQRDAIVTTYLGCAVIRAGRALDAADSGDLFQSESA